MSELRGYDAWKTDTSSEDDRLSTEAECVHCIDEFPRDQLNERGYCARCAPKYDGKDPNYDPPDDAYWDDVEFPYAENH